MVPRPFRYLGERLGLDEDEVLSRISRLKEEGLIRRIGPIVDMRRLGKKGVLVALAVPEGRLDEVSGVINRYPEISHNYLRPNDSVYNMWFTVSASMERIGVILGEIESRTGLDLLVLDTKRIFKIGVKFDII